ncbi:Anion-transporting ATPase, ArsA/GET3 family [Ferrithrix thermotolerans DSM 19514]|uniref:Anion-transporting ATPase, ArsA/GET3 family n=1 Tax=Ferrithrix thermotolerans DSM 19514 TaxID=1121881 RepID=A0A1M4TEJ9_9ACTN|nr:ArsA family ATPase [Ferrithrix thermotolerans]SHE42805.1 Anion-transporting ATPase, ArsA/GET3 family [Ferrithrix thermotolerans DSM 19514]
MAQFRPESLLAEIADDPKVIFVTGKGGVGKTTVSTLLVKTARDSGLRCAEIVLGDFAKLEIQDEDEVDLASEDPGPEQMPKDILSDNGDSKKDTINIDPSDALVEYMQDHGFGKVASRLIATGVIGVVSTAIPGIRDLLLLGKIKQIERDLDYDLLVVDSPATGHALSFLSSPSGLRDIASIGPLRSQAEDVIAMLQDPQRVGCVIVTIPEETPVAESMELLNLLTNKIGVKVTSVVINQVIAAVGEVEESVLTNNQAHPYVNAYNYRKGWTDLQRQHINEISQIGVTQTVELPLVFEAESPDEVAEAILKTLRSQSLEMTTKRDRHV